jgi:hypothetical protein
MQVGNTWYKIKESDLWRLGIHPAEVDDLTLKQGVAIRAPDGLPSKVVIETHNLTHIPFAPWCEICCAAKSTTDHHFPSEKKNIPLVQIDYQYISASGDFCEEMQSKAVTLTIVDTDYGDAACN